MSDTKKKINEGVVIGDSGGDATNIASGEMSGNIVNAGSGGKTKLNKEKKRKIVKRISSTRKLEE